MMQRCAMLSCLFVPMRRITATSIMDLRASLPGYPWINCILRLIRRTPTKFACTPDAEQVPKSFRIASIIDAAALRRVQV